MNALCDTSSHTTHVSKTTEPQDTLWALAIVNDVDNRGGYACVGAGNMGESLYLLFNFVTNLRLL